MVTAIAADTLNAMDAGVVILQLVVAALACAAIVKIRRDRRSRFFVACAITTLIAQLVWLPLEALNASGAVIAPVLAPFALSAPLLLVAGKISELLSTWRQLPRQT